MFAADSMGLSVYVLRNCFPKPRETVVDLYRSENKVNVKRPYKVIIESRVLGTVESRRGAPYIIIMALFVMIPKIIVVPHVHCKNKVL